MHIQKSGGDPPWEPVGSKTASLRIIRIVTIITTTKNITYVCTYKLWKSFDTHQFEQTWIQYLRWQEAWKVFVRMHWAKLGGIFFKWFREPYWVLDLTIAQASERKNLHLMGLLLRLVGWLVWCILMFLISKENWHLGKAEKVWAFVCSSNYTPWPKFFSPSATKQQQPAALHCRVWGGHCQQQQQ